ncbi:MAG: TMEM165/GDT1 family protein [Planctomycetes bacterium]|nr:TMEM165/GDT1 family protein [Planctomycetota bacterium]
MKIFATIFLAVFLAELGDKTQLATLLFSTRAQCSRLLVFLASSSALIATSAIAVLAGGLISRWVSPKVMSISAGSLFILLGALILASAFRTA